jgi:hypothetical protein
LLCLPTPGKWNRPDFSPSDALARALENADPGLPHLGADPGSGLHLLQKQIRGQAYTFHKSFAPVAHVLSIFLIVAHQLDSFSV